MNKKKIIILMSIVLFILIIVTTSFLYEMSNSDYEKARKETFHFLEKNITELEMISKECLYEKNRKTDEFKNKEYYFVKKGEKEYAVINIDAQGMLGGQYCDLIYCEDDYLDGNTIDIYDEYKETGSGNNIFIVEKIKDNWYFSYQDWDGKVDITEVGK